ncbi:unnamed protein product [Xylocopa violacea]|uniref:Gustatory receptor n=1 Tax=Xylocopa violacea TaxID=135666 RepID=A0ABP1NIE4_XYLVO
MAINSYEEATALITVVNQLLALRNFVDPKKNKFKFVCSWIYHIFLVSLLSSYFVFGQIMVDFQMKFNIHKLLFRFTWIMVICGYMATVSSGLYNSKEALLLIKQIKNVDEKLDKLGVNIEYRGFSRRVLITELMWTLNLIVSWAFYFKLLYVRNESTLGFFHAICSTCIFYSAATVLHDFMTVVYWLGLRFGQLNELLDTLLLQDRRTNEMKKDGNTKILVKSTLNFRGRSRLHEVPNLRPERIGKVYSLEKIRLVHLGLCSVSKMLNRIFSKQLLFYVFMAVNSLIIILYTLYIDIMGTQPLYPTATNVTILLLTDAVYNFLKVGAVSYCCEYTAGQRGHHLQHDEFHLQRIEYDLQKGELKANKMIDIIHASTLYDEDPDLGNEILQFCLQISYMQPGKSKSTSFWLNYSFLHHVSMLLHIFCSSFTCFQDDVV